MILWLSSLDVHYHDHSPYKKAPLYDTIWGTSCNDYYLIIYFIGVLGCAYKYFTYAMATSIMAGPNPAEPIGYPIPGL